MRRAAAIFSALMLGPISCSHSIHQAYVTSMEADAAGKHGHWVTVESKDFVILAFTFDSDYVERGVRQLEAKCHGPVAQVSTERLTSYKFLSYDERLILKGYCLDHAH